MTYIVKTMKKDEVPQDLSSLGKITKEVCYATDSSGKYVAGFEQRLGCEGQRRWMWPGVILRNVLRQQNRKVLDGEASPLLFFMEYRLMDASYFSRLYRVLAMADQTPFKTGSF